MIARFGCDIGYTMVLQRARFEYWRVWMFAEPALWVLQALATFELSAALFACGDRDQASHRRIEWMICVILATSGIMAFAALFIAFSSLQVSEAGLAHRQQSVLAIKRAFSVALLLASLTLAFIFTQVPRLHRRVENTIVPPGLIYHGWILVSYFALQTGSFLILEFMGNTLEIRPILNYILVGGCGVLFFMWFRLDPSSLELPARSASRPEAPPDESRLHS